ncbi:helix-turn-helix domain-containing protein [Haloarchaeobius sp. TZWSO28]|uniref:helix-turn-helix domain-containing protein n=1 Tax=Haloarchaeobius sp. TZWSO28 TaxID=3446119 RepID=UPI003EC04CF1
MDSSGEAPRPDESHMVIADVTVPAHAFELGRVFENVPNARVELERIVPIDGGRMPLIWVSNEERAEARASLEASSATSSVIERTDDGDRTLFEVRWTEDPDGLVSILEETNAKLLEGTGIGEGWDLRIQFDGRPALRAFRDKCTEADIRVLLRRIYNPHVPRNMSLISGEQREAIVLAFEHGYFEVPRRTSAMELGEMLGISDNAFSQRLRRGLSALVETTLLHQ